MKTNTRLRASNRSQGPFASWNQSSFNDGAGSTRMLRLFEVRLREEISGLAGGRDDRELKAVIALTLTTWNSPKLLKTMERETGVEPATSSLGSWHSTTELLPRSYKQTSISILRSARSAIF